MRKSLTPGALVSVVLAVLSGACGPQEPAAAPLPAPPPAQTPLLNAPPPPESSPLPPAAPELTPAQRAKVYQDCEAAFNAKDLAKYADCFSENAAIEQVDHASPAVTGRDALVKHVTTLAAAFPDLTSDAQLTLANGNDVVAIVLLQGTQQGPLPGSNGALAPTNKRVAYTMAQHVQIHGGKITKEHLYYDGRTVLAQLGVMPGPIRKAAPSPEKPVVIASGTPVEAQNLETYRRYIDAFNRHDAKAIESFLGDDMIYSEQSAPVDLVGKRAVQKGIQDVWKAFSDVRAEPKTVWAAGDYVVATSTFSGTNDGPIPSLKLGKKTGKTIALNVLEVVRLEDAKVQRHWVFSNGLAFANQLGLSPPPAAGRAQ